MSARDLNAELLELDEAYRKLYFDYCRLNDRLIDAELDLRLERLPVVPVRRSPFDE